jgi:hypothetical protein
MKTPRVHDFDPTAQVPELGSSMENLPTIRKPQPKENASYQIPERPNVSTPHRPNVRRIITRNSFEIYEDQMDDLRREAYEEKLSGGMGSMSKMEREAIDTYLEKRKAEK